MMLPTTITVRNSEYRPCLVDGKKALFHRFVEDNQLLLQFEGFIPMKGNYVQKTIERYKTDNILPSDVKPKIVKAIFALIELEDGTVKKVDIESIKFLDSGNLFEENFIFFESERMKGDS